MSHLNTKRLYLIVSLILFSTTCLLAQKKSKPEPIITIGGAPIFFDEFKYIYTKNNSQADDAFTQKSLDEYLDLYTNFKLKVHHAKQLGRDTMASFINELSTYVEQLAKPYLSEKQVTEKLVTEAYDRMKEEVKASHILIKVAEDAEPQDTLAAYKKIMDIRSQYLKGTDFKQLARSYSEDPSAQTNSGELGYFTALQMVYPFEDMAFKTKVGTVSMPIRTSFGYHIIKVDDRRPTQGKVKVAHIMVRGNAGLPAEDSVEAVRRINEIYQKLESGANWKDLCSEFSEDEGSKFKEGILPVFGAGNMLPTFEDASFALKNPDDFSKPVRTPYGWHVIKLIEKYPLEPFDKLESQIRARVARDSRSQLNQRVLLQRLKTENAFKEKTGVFEKKVVPTADSSVKKGFYKYDEKSKLLPTVLFTIGKEKYTVKDFYEFFNKNQRNRPQTPAHIFRTQYQEFINHSLLEYEKARLEDKHEDYRMLVREYRDGILLFQLMDENVWGKAMKDSAGLANYFESNNSKYQFGQRAKVKIYTATNEATLTKAMQMIASGRFLLPDVKYTPASFVKNKAELSADVKTKLDEIVAKLKTDSTQHLDVQGHVAVGEKVNIAKLRAKAVADYLVSKGINAQRLKIIDRSTREPVSGEKITSPKNARVTFLAYGTTEKDVVQLLTQQDALAFKITEGTYEKDENPILSDVPFKVGEYKPKLNDRIALIKVIDIEAPRNKNLDEARGQAISDYQQYLEKTWISDLKKLYPVVVNRSLLSSLVKK